MSDLIPVQLSKKRKLMIPTGFFASSLCQPLCLSCAELLRFPRLINTERALIIVRTQTAPEIKSVMDEATFDTIKITPFTRKQIIYSVSGP